MMVTEPADPAPALDPAPCFASEAEIALAEQLRRRLEQRYLGDIDDASESGPPAHNHLRAAA